MYIHGNFFNMKIYIESSNHFFFIKIIDQNIFKKLWTKTWKYKFGGWVGKGGVWGGGGMGRGVGVHTIQKKDKM
jgi:hypothetical protein